MSKQPESVNLSNNEPDMPPDIDGETETPKQKCERLNAGKMGKCNDDGTFTPAL